MPFGSWRLHPAHRSGRFVCSALLLLQLLPPTPTAQARPTHAGKWTGTYPLSATAVNLVLLPGWSTTYHSRVLYWDQDLIESAAGNVIGWKIPNDTTTNTGTFPTSSFTSLGLDDPPLLHGQPSNFFCAGQTMLADGRLLVTGGTDIGETGTVSTLYFDPAADANGEWARANDMAYRRWYGNNVLLPDSRVITTSGSSYAHYFTVGGYADAAPDTQTRMLQRIGISRPGTPEPSAVPLKYTAAAEPFAPVSEAAGLVVYQSKMLVYGGIDANQDPTNAAHLITRERNEYGSDYQFRWDVVTQAQAQSPQDLPGPRTGATLLNLSGGTDLLLVGGKDATGPSSDVWRGAFDSGTRTITWRKLTNQSTTQLPALHGHMAVYDKKSDKLLNRVFVYGGAGTAADTPTNPNVYSLRLGVLPTSDTLYVTQATATGPNPPPAATSYASLTYVPFSHRGVPDAPDSNRTRALLFGGLTPSDEYSDGLYAMWIYGPDDVRWEAVPLNASPRPLARARHAAALDELALVMVVSGGQNADSAAMSTVWSYNITCPGVPSDCDVSGSPNWEQQPSLSLPVRGHAAASIAPEAAFARFPEVFTPGTGAAGTWQTLTGAPHWQEWYPFGFTAPRRTSDPMGFDSVRVFYAGPEWNTPTIQLSTAAPQWRPMTGATANFFAGSAVMYRPGKVMKCGTRDTGGSKSTEVFGRTAVIDLKVDTPAWTEAAPADQMLSRRNHNLVILPTGEVLVSGGARYGGNDVSTDANCVKMPQIWSPDTLAAGHWYGQEAGGIRFDSSSVRRHYHSTAILLPDGRVLCAGGAFDNDHSKLADLYSPYYLFNADGTPRARPVISDVATSIAYRETFPVSMAAGGPTVTSMVIIRPGATTHGFDQNQRYVPLTIQSVPPVSGKPRFLVTAPSDSLEAPPGDYLLFAMDANGTPAIARWVRLRATNAAPGAPSLTTLIKVCAQPTTVQIEWAPPTVDAATGATNPGPVAQYQMRYKVGTMTPLEFETATPANPPAPIDPVPVGQQVLRQTVTLGDLTPSTQYTVRLRSKNFSSGEGNWSDLGNSLTFTTTAEECGGSGGGGGGCCQEGASARLAGGSSMRRPGGGGGNTAFLENTLFANLRPDVPATDLLRLPYGPRWTSTAAQVRLSRTGLMGTSFNQVRLLAVPVPEGQEAFTAGGTVVVGSLVPAMAIRLADGRGLATSLDTDLAFDGHVGDTLLVEFADATPGRIALVTSDAQLVAEPRRTGLELQCETAEGWTTVAHHDPRELRSDALHDVPSPGRLRLVFLGDHRLHAIARFAPGDAAAVTAYEPASLVHSVAGEVRSSLEADGALIAPGEAMVAEFAVAPTSDPRLEWFLEVGGKHTAVAATGTFSQQGGPRVERPLRFALEQNQPNPFGSETRIGFELPRRTSVRLEVFDLLGRRVAVLAHAAFDPGRHSITWDRRGHGGSTLPAGVYTYRFTAGEYREQRRLVMFP